MRSNNLHITPTEIQPQTKNIKTTPKSKQMFQKKSFIIPKPTQASPTTLTVHNLSGIPLTQSDLELLSKGLSFAPQPTTTYKKSQLRLLSDYDQFARTLRSMYVHTLYTTTLSGEKVPLEPTITDYVFRKMKFLPKSSTVTFTQVFSGVPQLEHYIELTKNNLNDQMQDILKKPPPNLTKKEKNTIKSFKNASQTLTIKPADKNLGIVIMKTDDYLQQCAMLLKYL